MLESGLQKLITSDPTVQSLIANRLYPLVWPSDEPVFPLGTYQRISTVTTQALAGTLSLVTCRVQIDSWSKSYLEVKAVAAAIDGVLSDFAGVLPGGTNVVNVSLDAATDLYDSPTSTFRLQADYLVTFHI